MMPKASAWSKAWMRALPNKELAEFVLWAKAHPALEGIAAVRARRLIAEAERRRNEEKETQP
jgi:hypothetical protein